MKNLLLLTALVAITCAVAAIGYKAGAYAHETSVLVECGRDNITHIDDAKIICVVIDHDQT